MNAFRNATTCAAWLVLLCACGGSSSDGTAPQPPVVTDAGLLRKITSDAEFEASLKSGLTAIQDTDGMALSVGGAPAPLGAAEFTGTYTQEANVDEFDAVRYDGEHLYVAPRRYLDCCFILPSADGAIGTGDPPERSIRILTTDPEQGSARLAGEIPLEENLSVQGMYLADDRLFALTGESIYGSHGEFWADFALWAPERLGYRVYDVSDPGAPVLEVDVKIDGIFVDSRRIGDTVYIVSRYTPSIDGLVYYVTTPEQQQLNETILAAVTLDDMLPKITVNGTSTSLVRAADCFVTNTGDDPGYPVITSVTAVPISDPASASTTCYNDEAYGVYVAEGALYFTESRPQPALSRYDTRIHKFALSGPALEYRGSIDIEGQVWRGGQADFRMSEHAGDLRVLASTFDWNSDDFVDHKLYVLRESDTSTDLVLVSELPNATRPAEIGKPNEALYGVRFLAETAYAVTFERIDPLYVIDLADPADPLIAGELLIPGFSDFLHPVSDDLLLGLGTGDEGGIKLELFDVADIAQPLSRGQVTLGDRGSFSEAQYNRHAFTYQQVSADVDRFTVPAELQNDAGESRNVESGLYLFEIRDKSVPSLTTLEHVGALVPDIEAAGLPPVATRSRAYLHGEAIFFVRDETVWAAFWHSPALVNGPL